MWGPRVTRRDPDGSIGAACAPLRYHAHRDEGIGAAVSLRLAASETLKQYLVNCARTFIFSTALPPYLAAQLRATVRSSQPPISERTSWLDLHAFLRGKLRDAGFDTGRSDSQILPVLLGSNERTLRILRTLLRAGFAVPGDSPADRSRRDFTFAIIARAAIQFPMLERLVGEMINVREQLSASLCSTGL